MPSPVFSPPPVPPKSPPTQKVPFTTNPSLPIAIPVTQSSTPQADSSTTSASAPEEMEARILLEEVEEPQVQDVGELEFETVEAETKAKTGKKDEKSDIVTRLEKELPNLPEKMKKNIIKELLKRPEGKLRETWFQVYVYKNKQYATKE